jgi:WD40 repeat protein
LDDWQRAPVLISRASKYITWHKALYGPSQQSCDSTAATIDISATTASYKLIDHLTEEVIAPHSLAFTPDGKRFLAGSKNQISLFDINITNGPIQKIRTIPSTRSKLKDGGVGYKGTVSALGMAPSSGMFASGTWSSHVALHRVMNGNVVQLITHFPLPRKYNRHMFERERIQGLRGHGVSQLKFSPCENYLYIAERLSDAILIYDVRNVSLSLGHCAGRNAHTIQKFGFDICSTPLGHEVWAGGVDGMVRVWKDPYGKEGSIEPDFVLPMGQAPVSSTIVHPCGNLAITATGRIDVDEPEEDEIVQRTGIYPRHTGRGSLNLFELGSSTDEVVQWE